MELNTKEIFTFLTNDFESAWNSLANNQSASGRGNFMFALLDMILLEFVSRLCSTDSSGEALKKFSEKLHYKDNRYFTKLPGICCKTQDFTLPYIHSQGDELIWAIWDLIRNGQSHQYLQMLANLTDKTYFSITLTGAEFNCFLNPKNTLSHPNHLSFSNNNNLLTLTLFPDILFSHIKQAVIESKILEYGLIFKHLGRPSITKNTYYNFTSNSLKNALINNNHTFT